MRSAHESIIRSGSIAINRWRADNPNVGLTAVDVNFSGLDLSGADLSFGNFAGSLFCGSNLTEAILHGACLVNTDFTDCDLRGADLASAKLMGANFRRCMIDRCNFDGAVDLSRTRALEEVRLSQNENVKAIGSLKLQTIDWLIPWHRLRAVGRLPLFTPSYVTTGLLFVYFGMVSYWNEAIGQLYDLFVSKLHLNAEIVAIFDEIKLQSMKLLPSSRSLLLLITTISLGAGATVYLLACPSRVQAFTIDEWEFAHGQPRLQYLASSWQRPKVRVLCALSYAIGGAIGIYLVGYNLTRYLWFAILNIS
jgi:uncharacterized protein YjbI with pentapeptide repeats